MMELRPKDSPSSLNTFSQCRRRYLWNYLCGNPRGQFNTMEAVMGTAVHAAIEKYYRGLQEGVEYVDAELVAEFVKVLDTIMSEQEVVSPKPERDLEWAHETGLACLENFHVYRKNYMEHERVISVECEVGFEPMPGWKVGGFIDYLGETDQEVVVRDWKTGALPYHGFAGSSVARQLGMYALAAEQIASAKKKKVIVAAAYLAPGPFGQKPEGYRAELTPGARTEIEVWVRGERLRMQDALREDNWRASSSPLCGWCEWAWKPEGDKFHCALGAMRRK